MPEAAFITLETKGFDKLNAALTRLTRANKDLRVPLKRIGVHMHKSIAQNFTDQGIPEIGVQWAPLSERTIKQRRKGEGAGTPQKLMDTGHMRMSVVSVTGPGTIYKLSKESLVIGTNVPYATDHQPLNGAAQTVKPEHYIPNTKVKAHRRQKRTGRGTFRVREHTRNQFVPEQVIPSRFFLAIKPSDADRAANIILDWEVEQIAKGWVQ